MPETFDSKKVATATAAKKRYYSDIGVDCSAATDLDTAIKISGLDFRVAKYPISFKNEYLEHDSAINDDVVKTEYIDVPRNFCTVRTDTMTPLGVVGNSYKILDNIDAFSFLDSLIAGGSAQYQTAGTIGTDARSFITVSTDPIKILDDDIDNYIMLLNSHDGSSSVKACMTPIRCACANTVMLALKQASNKVTIRHCSTLDKKLEAAKELLIENTNYMNALKKEAEKLAVKPFTRDAYLEMIKKLNPVNMDAKHIEVELERNAMIIDQLTKAYDQADLNNFVGTAYRALQAVADAETHKTVFRQTKMAPYASMLSAIDGMPLTNLSYDYIMDYI